MAIVRKVKNASAQQQEEKVVAPVVKKQPIEVKEEKQSSAPVAKKQPTGGKKVSLINKPKTTKSFELKEGSQCTQETFIDILCKKLIDREIEVNKAVTQKIMRAYGETLKEVTDVACYREPVSNIFYRRVFIGERITNPPRAAGGLKTLMKGHNELKVRKLLGDESTFKFFGEVSEDGTTFIAHVFDEDGNDTGETVEIPLEEASNKVSNNTKKVVAKKPTVVIEKSEEIDDEDEEYFDEDELEFDEDEE